VVAYSVEIPSRQAEVTVLTDGTSRPPRLSVDGVAISSSMSAVGHHSYHLDRLAARRHEMRVVADRGGCALLRLDIETIADEDTAPA